MVLMASSFLLLVCATCMGGDDAISEKYPVNETPCQCEQSSCCVCVHSLVKNALTVRIFTDDFPDFELEELKVVLVNCANKDKNQTPAEDAGPRFDSENGPSYKDIKCDEIERKFDIYGGPKDGTFPVLIYWKKKDGSENCSPCGSICIYPKKGSGYKTLSFGTKSPNTPEGFQNNGASGCGQATATTALEDFPPRWKKATTTFSVGGVQREHKEVLDYGVQTPLPNPALNAGKTGQKIGEYSNSCGQKLELYCFGGQFKLFFSECDGDSKLIGVCLWTAAQNTISVVTEKCGSNEAWTKVQLNNVDRKQNRNRVDYDFDVCKKELSRKYERATANDSREVFDNPPAWQDGGAGDFSPPPGFGP